MSHPAKTRSFNPLSGTNSWILGVRLSVRLPSRIVPNCVSDPTGCDLPVRTSSTPAINVVLTAPIPGSSTPNFPFAGAIFPGFSIPLLHPPERLPDVRRPYIWRADDPKVPARPGCFSLLAGHTNASQPQKQTTNDARSSSHLQRANCHVHSTLSHLIRSNPFHTKWPYIF